MTPSPSGVQVRDARPPQVVMRIVNPLLRALLRTPIGRVIRPLALVEFNGRRSGRRISVVVGWHGDSDARQVFTPAAWRVNFDGGAAARVRFRGRVSEQHGVLDDDPARVATALNSALGGGTSARALALRVPRGQAILVDDVVRTGRAVVRFRPAAPP